MGSFLLVNMRPTTVRGWVPSMEGPWPSLRALARVLGGRGVDYYDCFPCHGFTL